MECQLCATNVVHAHLPFYLKALDDWKFCAVCGKEIINQSARVAFVSDDGHAIMVHTLCTEQNAVLA